MVSNKRSILYVGGLWFVLDTKDVDAAMSLVHKHTVCYVISGHRTVYIYTPYLMHGCIESIVFQSFFFLFLLMKHISDLTVSLINPAALTV